MTQFLSQKKFAFQNHPPASTEGRDGDFVVVKIGQEMYLYSKQEGAWYRIKFERI